MATIRRNGSRESRVRSFVFLRGSGCVAVQIQALGLALLSKLSIQLGQIIKI